MPTVDVHTLDIPSEVLAAAPHRTATGGLTSEVADGAGWLARTVAGVDAARRFRLDQQEDCA